MKTFIIIFRILVMVLLVALHVVLYNLHVERDEGLDMIGYAMFWVVTLIMYAKAEMLIWVIKRSK